MAATKVHRRVHEKGSDDVVRDATMAESWAPPQQADMSSCGRMNGNVTSSVGGMPPETQQQQRRANTSQRHTDTTPPLNGNGPTQTQTQAAPQQQKRSRSISPKRKLPTTAVSLDGGDKRERIVEMLNEQFGLE